MAVLFSKKKHWFRINKYENKKSVIIFSEEYYGDVDLKALKKLGFWMTRSGSKDKLKLNPFDLL